MQILFFCSEPLALIKLTNKLVQSSKMQLKSKIIKIQQNCIYFVFFSNFAQFSAILHEFFEKIRTTNLKMWQKSGAYKLQTLETDDKM